MLAKINSYRKSRYLFLILFFFTHYFLADSFKYNTYNNHGVVGLINLPTARFFEESSHGITLYDGTPDQKITLSSSPYDWMEASFFYTNVQNKRYCNAPAAFCEQDYKDKGFNLKLRLKEEGDLPAIAIGLNDFAGTGLYSSEYIVSSYGIGNFDIHFGLGWGTLNGSSNNVKNPLGYIAENFKERPGEYASEGGQFQPSRYFSGKTASPFYGISYSPYPNILLKLERDTMTTNAESIDYDIITYEERESNYTFGLDYSFNENFTLGLSFERGNYFSMRFNYKNNPKSSYKKYKYQKAKIADNDSKYTKLIKSLEKNGIGVDRITETSSSIGLELSQFIHPNLQILESIISESSKEAGINKNIKKDLKIANLDAVNEIDRDFKSNAKLIYERNKTSGINTSTGLRFQPFLASREEFFKGAFLIENNTEFIITENLFLNTNIKYSLANNFDDLNLPPLDTFPAQVRSDVKDYLKNMDKGLLLGRAQFDYYITPFENHHFMATAGVLEDMFSGYGMEYLYFKQNTNYAIGFDIFEVKKRDYNWGFGTLDYENLTASFNVYYRNYGLLPFDMKFSLGEYLAGDVGATFDLSRSYNNGVKLGVFATFTDVSAEQFGEGSFDKGLYFNIPIYGNFIDYTWRPLTKDPGAKLTRRNTLYDLLVKFSPIN